MKVRYRHQSKPYPSENADGSRCQRPVLCSHPWMTSTLSAKWTTRERPISPNLQRRASIDPVSTLCPPRGGSTSPEKQLDSSFSDSHLEIPQGATIILKSKEGPPYLGRRTEK